MQSKVKNKVSNGQAKLAKMRLQTDAAINAKSPDELAQLPKDFWDQAAVVGPIIKQSGAGETDNSVSRAPRSARVARIAGVLKGSNLDESDYKKYLERKYL